MVEKYKKKLPLIFGIFSIILVLLIFSFLGFKNQHVVKETNGEHSKLNYVLVNEDEGTVFENKAYNLGNDFVYLINKDNKNNWETTSYSLANAGFKNGQYDVAVIIPHDFSKRLLSLKSIDPKKALVKYKIRDGQNEIANQEVQGKVNNILKDFNRRIVKMYFSSIVGNLSDAQQNVSRIVSENQDAQKNMTNMVYSPLKLFPDSYQKIFDNTSILSDENDHFNESQKDFISNLCSQIHGNYDGLMNNKQQLYSLNQNIIDTNKENANTANTAYSNALKEINEKSSLINQQWNNDKQHYNNLYKTMTTEISNEVNGLNSQDTQSLNQLVSQLNQFEKAQLNNINALESAIHNLEKQKEILESTRQSFAKKYYGTDDPSKVTDQQLTQVLSQLMKNNGETVKLFNQYKEKIDQQIPNINLDAIETALDYLKLTHQISDEQYSNYQNKITIIKRYTSNYEKENQNIYSKEKTDEDKVVNKNNTVTLSIDPTKENTLTIIPVNDKYKFNLKNIKTDDIKKSLNKQLSPYKYIIDHVEVNGDKIIISKARKMKSNDSILNSETTKDTSSDKTTEKESSLSNSGSISNEESTTTDNKTSSITESIEENSTTKEEESVIETTNSDKTESVENTIDTNTESTDTNTTTNSQTESSKPTSIVIINNKLPLKISTTFNFDLEWTVPNNTDNAYVPYQWKSDIFGKESTGLCMTQNHLGIVLNTSNLLKALQQLDETSQQIVTLYGAPGKTITTEEYAKYINNHSGSLSSIADSQSIYYLYNKTLKYGLITPEVVQRYKKNLDETYNNITQQINQISSIIGKVGDDTSSDALTTIHQLLTRPEEITKQANDLLNKYQQVQKSINDIYKQWEDSDKEDNSSSMNNEKILDGKSTDLSQNIQDVSDSLRQMMRDSKDLAKETKTDAAKMNDLSPAIKSLNKSAKEINGKTKDLIGDTNQLIKQNQDKNNKNNNYSKNFNNVLSNAKNGGDDNPAVFNFLSDPLNSEGKLGKFSEDKGPSLIPYYATLIGAIVAIATSLLLSGQMKLRDLDEEHQMMEHSTVWQNIPNIKLIGLVSVLVSLIYAVILTLLHSSLAVFWYSFLIEIGTIWLLVAGLRSYKKITLIVYTIIFGMFIMLTPLLGVVTRHGTLTYWLYRISPLQNMQSGFTFIFNNLSIGIVSYIVLILLLIVGIIINLFIRQDSRMEIEEKNV